MAHDAGNARRCDADEDGARLHAVLVARPSDARDADAAVGAVGAAGGVGHRAGGLLADRAVGVERLAGHAGLRLHLVGVRDGAADEVVGRAGDLRERRADHAAGARLQHRERVALLAQQVADALRRVLLVGAPDVVAEGVAHHRLGAEEGREGLGLGVGLRDAAQVDAVLLRVDAEVHAGDVVDVAHHLVDGGLAQTDGLERPGHDLLAGEALLEARGDLGGPHVRELARRAGERDEDLVALLYPPAGRGAHGVADGDGGGDDAGLAVVLLRHGVDVAAREVLLQPHPELRVRGDLLAEHVGDAVARHVVERGAEAAHRDDDVRPAPRAVERLGEAREVVADDGDELELEAELRQALAEPGRVGVLRLAHEELGADGDDLGVHVSPIREWQSGEYSRESTSMDRMDGVGDQGCQRRLSMALLVGSPRVNRKPGLALLALLVRGVCKAAACFPRPRMQGRHRMRFGAPEP